MTQASDIPQRRTLARIGHFVAARRKLVFDYLSAVSGAGGRLVFSLAYFIALANPLS
ncbi:lipopolysaccharide biosynthesis protein, partial [Mesorhizobium sp. USDA-HM6]